MGCFNIKDVITNNDIYEGEEINAIILKKVDSYKSDIESETYITDKWEPMTMPFSGKYNDYGTMKNIDKEDLTVKLLEKIYEIDISDIFTLILEGRHMYSSCSSALSIFKKDKELITTFNSYDKITFDMLKICDDRFTLIKSDENSQSVELNYSRNQIDYKLTFDIIKNEDIYIKLYKTSIDYNTKEKQKITKEIITNDKNCFMVFSKHQHIADFFEKLSDNDIELIFTQKERNILKELKQCNIMFFNKKVINFTNNNFEVNYNEKENTFDKQYEKFISYNNTIKELIHLKIKEEVENDFLFYKENSDKEITKEELYIRFTKNNGIALRSHLEEEFFKCPLLPRDKNRFRKFWDMYYPIIFNSAINNEEINYDLIKKLCEFYLLDKHLNYMNIVYRPSNYSGQERDREYEIKWNKFLVNHTYDLLLEEKIDCGEGFSPDNIEEAFEKKWIQENEKFKIYDGNYHNEIIIFKNKNFELLNGEIINLKDSMFKFIEFIEN